MLSQLGHIILNASSSTSDEMSAAPDPDGGFGAIDDLLEEISLAVQTRERGGERRPGSDSPAE